MAEATARSSSAPRRAVLLDQALERLDRRRDRARIRGLALGKLIERGKPALQVVGRLV